MIPQLLRYVTENTAMPWIPHFESPTNRCSFVLSTARNHFNTYHIASTVKTKMAGQPRKAAPGYFEKTICRQMN